MLSLSKSKYCSLWQCPKMAWLKKYKPDALMADSGTQSRMETGTDVGALARGLFGDFVEVTVEENGELDLQKMIAATKREMEQGTPVICEASFVYEGLYCAVDILKKESDGWAIYEVKSSTKGDKPVYFADIAYQKYVLELCGVKVVGTYVVTLNSGYVFDGTLDIQKLFKITDVSDLVAAETKKIPNNLRVAEEVLNSPDEPDIDLSEQCKAPYPCVFWDYCTKHIPKPSVFDLYRLPFKKQIEYYHNGVIRFEDLIRAPEITDEKQIRQMEYATQDLGTYVDQAGVQTFLDTLSYPLYFLDFETMMPAVPCYIGTRPYTQIPFQYSLHYIETPGGELKHKEFLADPGEDPRRKLAEQLCADIPEDACVTAYNKGFECTQIKALASIFSDLADHLLNIESNVKDLLVPFQSGYYYNRAMGSSFSIKSVLPAIYPDDPELDYHNLECVHNGSEAMALFPKLNDMPPEQREAVRQSLLKYCELDTLAMVKVWEELVRVAQ